MTEHYSSSLMAASQNRFPLQPVQAAHFLGHDVLGIPLAWLQQDGPETLLPALSGTIAYRQLEPRQRVEVLSAIHRLQDRRLVGRLSELCATVVAWPRAHTWAMSDIELARLQKQVGLQLTIMGYSGLPAGASQVWQMIRSRSFGGPGGVMGVALLGYALYLDLYLDSQLDNALRLRGGQQ